MATASKTPKSSTPRKRTPKRESATTAATAVPESDAAKPAPKARPKRAAKAPVPVARVKKRSGLGTLGVATLAATGLSAIGAIAFSLLRNRVAPSEPGTTPTDLLGDNHPDGSVRAIEQFRPDPTAPIPASERDAFRPALAGGSTPTLVAGQAGDLHRTDAAPS